MALSGSQTTRIGASIHSIGIKLTIAPKAEGDLVIPEVVEAGGAKPRRRHRQFANIDGKLVEVSSFKEAEELIRHFNKGISTPKPKKRRITFNNGPYVSVYDNQAIPLRQIKKILKNYHQDEEMLLLLMIAA